MEIVPRTPKSRDETKAETREALLIAGLAAFAEQGLDGPSLDAICARAGFTRGAFYVHFADRDEFLVAVMERVFGLFLDAIIATGDAARDLEHTVERFAAAVAIQPADRPLPLAGIALHKVLDACARSPVLRARFVGLLQEGAGRVAASTREGQRAETVRDDVAPEAMGQLLSLLALGIVTAFDLGLPLDAQSLRTAALRLIAPARDESPVRGRRPR